MIRVEWCDGCGIDPETGELVVCPSCEARERAARPWVHVPPVEEFEDLADWDYRRGVARAR